MSKTCPNCGVNSPDNAKFCIECAHDLTDVPIIKDEVKPKNTNGNGLKLGSIALIAIALIVVIAAGFFIFGSGDDSQPEENIQITFDEVTVTDFTSSGKIYYNYFVKGFITNIPKDCDGYMLKTIYCDSQGRELTSTVEKLSSFKDNEKYDFSSTISFYQTQNYLDVDHVSVQLIKDNVFIKEFNSTMSTNKLTSNATA